MGNELSRTPSGDRTHIGFFGLRNAGKSSLVNAVAGQTLSIVSDVKGTTTDPVKKAMELLPLGPVLLIDTPGLDDEGELGALRVERAMDALEQCDAAVLVVDGTTGLQRQDRDFLERLKRENLPYLIAYTKSDLLPAPPEAPQSPGTAPDVLHVSATTGQGIVELKERLAVLWKAAETGRRIVGDLLGEGNLALLVTPVDASAPKGRLILPQVQTIRDILDSRAACLVTQTEQLPELLKTLRKPPKLVITDSQDFERVKDIVPKELPLTSFSILMARYKGILDICAAGALRLSSLQNGDIVLLSEGCTHHQQCQDIGTVKLPAWIRRFTGKDLQFQFTSGGEFPRNLSPYALVVHCGACMLGEREARSRLRRAREQGVPFTNYGVAIAHMNGILARSLRPLGMEPEQPESAPEKTG